MEPQSDANLSRLLQEWRVESAPRSLERQIGRKRRSWLAWWPAAAAAAVVLAVAGVGTAVMTAAQSQAALTDDTHLVFEAGLEWTPELPGRWAGSYSFRVQDDGTVITTQDAHGFLPLFRIERPDGYFESHIQFLPFPTGWGRVTPSAVRVQRGCVTGDGAVRLRTEQLHGYQTIVVQLPISNGRTLTMWRVPELGCQALQQRAEQVEADGTRTRLAESRIAWMRRKGDAPR